MEYKTGDQIIWVYRHWMNSKSSTLIQKTGVYIRPIVSMRGYVKPQISYVHFKGNKNPSRIFTRELELKKRKEDITCPENQKT